MVLVTFTSMLTKPITTSAAVDVQAKTAILVDAETGKILFEKDADVALPPASMTKMMTEYLVLEAINEGKISWDTTTQITDYPYSISADPAFSGVGLKQNQDYTVRELYEAMAINSDNATAIALAELVAGSEGDFVKMMNEKADQMGLPDAKFVNATGLANSDLGNNVPEGTGADEDNLMSARSAALLAYRLINDYPEALDISSMTTTEFDGQEIQNWNWMLPNMPGYLSQYGYEGMDGLKTGWTDLAGFCFTGTAERSDQRLISVVMKTDSKEARFEETRKLLDYGFNQFEKKELYPNEYQIEDQKTLSVTKGKQDTVEIASNAPLTTMIEKGTEDQYNVEYKLDDSVLNDKKELTAPIKKGQKVGSVKLVNSEKDFGYITSDGEQKESVDLVTQEKVEKSNWFMLMIGAITGFFADIFTSVVDTVKGWF
ncbi:D-alanyl-D-alanine carboxypeptidase [Pontibacillus sp. HN14]|uniref:serine-type D-Ala-D-Ala carboxypeptidase n=2 Tax=Bacillaceae TaxID=186817 RepID=A0ABY8V491_9BACI|nr:MULTISPECIES: serine hydrolase [Pontibacillus]MCD5325602.1 D-alanyl-D-alanine carboxypeptidase [Pontibacillus sp. HN14]WIG00284.1 serine hydrolase [Pontibacillus chungwhensis]